ncbi:MAG: pyridoxamine 5'-phosphate oxidase family protein [Coprobacillaceae bacterium]
MFREIRRQDRLLTEEEAKEILQEGRYGVLSLIGDNGYPYGVPMHYVLIGGMIYMHGTSADSHKVDAIKNNPKMSFTVMKMENDIKGKSCIVFGEIEIIKDMREVVLEKFVETHVPEFAWEQAKKGIPFAKDNIEAYKLTIHHISAKLVDKPSGK